MSKIPVQWRAKDVAKVHSLLSVSVCGGGEEPVMIVVERQQGLVVFADRTRNSWAAADMACYFHITNLGRQVRACTVMRKVKCLGADLIV